MFGVLMIMIILLAVLALVVVKALAHSPWGTFTVVATIPIAMLMGVYLRYVRPGPDREMSVIGFVLLMLAIFCGKAVTETPALAPLFTFSGETLAWMLIGYGFFASVLPVWLLLAPRDYLSTFLKIGTILGLAIGIVFVMPDLQMPAVTPLHRRHRPGVLRCAVPVPVHHHRLRRGVRLPLADRVRHHAQDGRQRGAGAAGRLRRHADGEPSSPSWR